MRRWEESDHNFLVMQTAGKRTRGTDGDGVSFLSLSPARMAQTISEHARQVMVTAHIVMANIVMAMFCESSAGWRGLPATKLQSKLVKRS